MLNARPTSTAEASNAHQLPVSQARSAAAQASTISSSSSGSTPLSRETATNDGNTASASEAPRAVKPPTRRRSIAYMTSTATSPQIASGSSRLSGLKPNSFALSTCSHSPSGGLSTLIRPPWSKDTNRKL